MRDINRIDEICEVLKSVWRTYPDLRLGQLLSVVAERSDLFYIEDDNMLKALKNFRDWSEQHEIQDEIAK